MIRTDNLTIGVLVGLRFPGLFCAAKIAQSPVAVCDQGDRRVCRVEGQIFYGPGGDFGAGFDDRNLPPQVVIGVTHARIRNISTVQAVNAAGAKFRAA